ncbi:hypothetical protein RRG08_032177 [Elysia crispata]|uniref:Uncharacterized protein n=1 Tax=Elysia crispata TaxID=231223 RepID=A0AAE1DVP9_9GAST|nr:hypothetical protein RRG08_032177 [Elysia crispata]
MALPPHGVSDAAICSFSPSLEGDVGNYNMLLFTLTSSHNSVAITNISNVSLEKTDTWSLSLIATQLGVSHVPKESLLNEVLSERSWTECRRDLVRSQKDEPFYQ